MQGRPPHESTCLPHVDAFVLPASAQPSWRFSLTQPYSASGLSCPNRHGIAFGCLHPRSTHSHPTAIDRTWAHTPRLRRNARLGCARSRSPPTTISARFPCRIRLVRRHDSHSRTRHRAYHSPSAPLVHQPIRVDHQTLTPLMRSHTMSQILSFAENRGPQLDADASGRTNAGFDNTPCRSSMCASSAAAAVSPGLAPYKLDDMPLSNLPLSGCRTSKGESYELLRHHMPHGLHHAFLKRQSSLVAPPAGYSFLRCTCSCLAAGTASHERGQVDRKSISSSGGSQCLCHSLMPRIQWGDLHRTQPGEFHC